MSVYGTTHIPFHWSQIDVVYPHLLQGLNHTCLFGGSHVYRKGIIGGTFVDYPSRLGIANGAAINRGGARLNLSNSAYNQTWPWMEVLHSPGHDHTSKQGHDNLWMYMARGSGVWFNPGRVLVLSDTWDLAVYMNVTDRYSPRLVGTKTWLMQHARRKLSRDFDSIAFLFHVDGSCCQRMVMRELVSLSNFSTRCPVSSSMRRGWPPDRLVACNCSKALVHGAIC